MMYAWSNITTGDVTINVGQEVSQSDLDISDSEWDDLVASGVVREQPYPENVAGGTSPNEYFKAQLTKAAQGDLTKDELGELQSAGLVAGVEEPKGEKPVTPKPAASK